MIIGTAGHIDHGKSTLLEALTGRRMDPLAEERRRGITLDLHFTELPLGDGRSAGVIDVPGHEDLVRTMVAGAGGLDLVILVIAADDGIMPQTREHLAIVEQLRVPAGVPVLTRADLVAPEWLEMVTAEVEAWLAASPVRFTRPVVTAAPAGRGIAALREAIRAATRDIPSRRRADDLFRLPIDRAFSLPGAGTVLTGTSWSGKVAPGDQVRVLPGGSEGRVRSVERHGSAVDASLPGERTAVAIAGLDRAQVHRGDVLVHVDAPWAETRALDVRLELLPSAPRSLESRARVRVHLGTAEVLARVQPEAPIPPGGAGLARVALEGPLVARGGDRLVLRSYSPVVTLGGGEVLDPLPPRGRPVWRAALGESDRGLRLVALAERRRAGMPLEPLPILLGVAPAEVEHLLARSTLVAAGGFAFPEQQATALRGQLLDVLADHHRRSPTEPGMPLETLRAGRGPLAARVVEDLAGSGQIVVRDGLVRRADFKPSAGGGDAALERVLGRLADAGLTPPTVAELEAELGVRGIGDLLRLAAREGRVTAVERDRYYSAEALDRFRAILAQVAAAGPFTPPAVRDAAGVSRKYLIPLLEWADRAGLTLRQGDARVAGPALRTPPNTG